MEKIEQILNQRFEKTPPIITFLVSAGLIMTVTFAISSIMGCSIFP